MDNSEKGCTPNGASQARDVGDGGALVPHAGKALGLQRDRKYWHPAFLRPSIHHGMEEIATGQPPG